MCFSSPKPPKVQPLPPERAQARAPVNVASNKARSGAITSNEVGGNYTRKTVVNAAGYQNAKRKTAVLGGTEQVVLGLEG